MLPWLRWSALAVAVAVPAVFLIAQRQTADISYRTAPVADSSLEVPDPPTVPLPSTAAMESMVRADPVVRLQGAVARWDTGRVREAIGDADVRILAAPAGLTEEQQRTLRDVEPFSEIDDDHDELADDTGRTVLLVTITGTRVSGGIYESVADDLAGWRAEFATADVTSQLMTLIAEARELPEPADVDLLRWRDPTPAELAPVTAALRSGRFFAADGATAERPPTAADTAFPGNRGLVAVFPRQPFGEPVPQYGPALARLFPDTPIVIAYGTWVEYHGPSATDFADVAAASFYGQFAGAIRSRDLPQSGILGVYLGRVTDVRYAGIFDRPLPYTPFDPLRVALPALPWVFGACVLLFLGLSVRSLLRPTGPGVRRASTPSRLAGLTALAIELSALTAGRSDAALARAISRLRAAGDALRDGLPDTRVRALLRTAETELDDAARDIGRDDYRPDRYLQGRTT